MYFLKISDDHQDFCVAKVHLCSEEDIQVVHKFIHVDDLMIQIGDEYFDPDETASVHILFLKEDEHDVIRGFFKW